MQLKHTQGRKKYLEGCKNCSYLHTAKDNIDALDEETFKSREPSEVFESLRLPQPKTAFFLFLNFRY